MDEKFRARIEKVAASKPEESDPLDEHSIDTRLMSEYEKAAAEDPAFAAVFNYSQGIISAQELNPVFEHRDKPTEERQKIAEAYAEYLKRKDHREAA